MTSPSEIYPFATQDGKAIPLDILKPAALSFFDFTSAAKADITISQESSVVMLLATEVCILSFNSALTALTAGAEYLNAVLVPKNIIVSCLLPGYSAQVRGVTASGVLYIQSIEKWSGLALDKQFQRK